MEITFNCEEYNNKRVKQLKNDKNSTLKEAINFGPHLTLSIKAL